MILIAGGTGTLGARVVSLLTARGLEVRTLTRDPERAEYERGDLVEIASGDVQDARAVERAVAGAQTVVSAVQGFAGADPAGPEAGGATATSSKPPRRVQPSTSSSFRYRGRPPITRWNCTG